MKKVVNANPGDSDHVGGNDWDKLADYFNDTNVSETPRINTPTEFRNGILKIRDSTNTYNVLIKSAAQTADRDWTIPALTGNDIPAGLGTANIFTALQTTTLDADTILALYRPVSTTNSLVGLGFYERNSSNAQVLYGAEYCKLIVNTAGTEDGALEWWVRKAGVLTKVMTLDKNGLLTVTSISGGGSGVGDVLSTASNTYGDFDQIFRSGRLDVRNPANTFSYSITGSAITAARAITLPLLTADDTIVVLALAQTLTNKTINATNNTITDTSTAAGDILKSDGTKFTRLARGSANQVLAVNSGGTDIAWATPASGGTAPTILLNDGTNVTTASTSTEFDMLNYSVAANTLGANGSLRVRLTGYLFNNQATAHDPRFKIKFGGTTMFDGQRTALAQSTINRPFVMEFTLGNKNSTSSQGLTGIMMLNDLDQPTTGEGTFDDDEQNTTAAFRGVDPAKATTSSQTLQITMTHSILNANVSTTVTRKTIEFLPGV